VGEEREVEENGGEEREGKKTDRCPLTVTLASDNINTTQTQECTKDKYNAKIIK
jgi:hypothetical protein